MPFTGNFQKPVTMLLLTGFIFQQDSTPAHTARNTQNGLQANCLDFITKEQWPGLAILPTGSLTSLAV